MTRTALRQLSLSGTRQSRAQAVLSASSALDRRMSVRSGP